MQEESCVCKNGKLVWSETMQRRAYYFSHDHFARHDPKLSFLREKYGMEGYGLWWHLVEVMHEQGGKIKKFPALFKWLANETKQNEAVLEAIISDMIHVFQLLKEDDTAIWSDRVLHNLFAMEEKRTKRVEAGRLGGIQSGLKRSIASSKRSKRTKRNEIKGNEIKEQTLPQDFVLLWERYPKKLGQKEALRHFKATVVAPQDLSDINKALDNYLSNLPAEQQFIKHGSTWFNQWRDWVDYRDPADSKDKIADLIRKNKEGSYGSQVAQG